MGCRCRGEVLRKYVVGNLGERDGVLIVDESGFFEKGEHSAGVNASTAGPQAVSKTARLACPSSGKHGRLITESAVVLLPSFDDLRPSY